MAASTTGELEIADSAIVVSTENAQKMRHYLEEDGLWDSSRRLERLHQGHTVAIPVKPNILSATDRGHFVKDFQEVQEKSELLQYSGETLASGCYHDLPCHFVSLYLPLSKKQLVLSPHQILVSALRERFKELDIPFPEEVQKEIPDFWEKHGDLILLPQMSFHSSVWERCPNSWSIVARVLGGHRVARKGRVKRDEFRSPRVELLLGNDGWVEHKDNGIRYAYDVRHCMFSIGNITEKLRVAGFDCSGETVVDLYAGIGYFTLPYLVHAKASVVHACEWNPDAAVALIRNLALNNVQDRCILHQGDNRQVCPRSVADRVNLGLIPSSKEGWPVACAALKPQSGGLLHIHGNVTSHTQRMQKKETASCGCKLAEHDQLSAQGATFPSGERTASDVPFTQQGVLATNIESKEGQSPTGLRMANPTRLLECTGDKGIQQSVSLPDVEISFQNSSATELPSGSTSGQDIKINERVGEDIKYSHEVQDELGKALRSTARGNSELAPKDYWSAWADSTAHAIHDLLVDIHSNPWTVDVMDVEHVKSYAPHVDHVVVDLRCLPTSCPPKLEDY